MAADDSQCGLYSDPQKTGLIFFMAVLHIIQWPAEQLELMLYEQFIVYGFGHYAHSTTNLGILQIYKLFTVGQC